MWQIGLLNSFRIEHDGQVVVRLLDRKQEQLLGYLGGDAGRPHLRHTIAEAFWPDKPEKLRNNRLSEVLVLLKKLLKKNGLPADTVIITRRTLQLNPAFTTDLEAFERLAARAQNVVPGPEAGLLLDELRRMYGAGFLPFLQEDWVQPHRERLGKAFEQAAAVLESAESAMLVGAGSVGPASFGGASGAQLPGWASPDSSGTLSPRSSPAEQAADLAPSKSTFDPLVALVEESEMHLWGRQAEDRLQRLDRAYPEITQALDTLIEEHDAFTAARIVGSLWPYWLKRKSLSEGRHYLEQVLLMLSSSQSAIYGKVLHGSASLALFDNDLVIAETRLQSARALWLQIGSRERYARAEGCLGVIAHRRGHFDVAREHHHKSLDLLREMHQPELLAYGLRNAAMNEIDAGEFQLARTLLEEQREISLRLEDEAGVGWALFHLCEIEQHHGNWSQAEVLAKRALQRFENGSVRGRAHCRLALAYVERKVGEQRSAMPMLERAVAEFRECGYMQGLAEALWQQASLHDELGDHDTALELLQQSHDLFVASGHEKGVSKTQAVLEQIER